MNKRIGVVFFILLTIFVLTGCQLAREDGGSENKQDKLIGAYVTYEHVDLFDLESYLNDNGAVSGGEIVVEGEQQKYNGRLYATRKDKVVTTEDGEKYTKTTYEFEGIEGVGMFSPTVSDSPDDENSYVLCAGDDGITDYKTNLKCGDYEEGMDLEGTIYVSTRGLENAVYTNPVYQSKDGQVYLVSGDGYSYSGEEINDSSLYTQTITDKVTVNDNGQSKEYSTTVKVHVEAINPTVKVTILQMDKDSKILKEEEYKPEEVPNELKAESTADFIIVESTKTTYDKKTKVDRTIFSKGEDSLWFFRMGENNVFIKTYTTILWNQSTE